MLGEKVWSEGCEGSPVGARCRVTATPFHSSLLYKDDTVGARKMTFRALFVPEKKMMIEYRYRSDTA